MFAATARSSRRCTLESADSSGGSPTLITPTEAAARARTLAAPRAAVALASDLVERLDGGNAYFLVRLGEPDGGGLIVAVDALTAAILSVARLDDVDRHRLPDRHDAVRWADYPEDSAARRVWAPSRATRSPFYPLWELKAGTECAYVDMNGKVWTAPNMLRD